MTITEIRDFTKRVLMENGVDEEDIVVEFKTSGGNLGETHCTFDTDDPFLHRCMLYGVPSEESIQGSKDVKKIQNRLFHVLRTCAVASVKKIVFSSEICEFDDDVCKKIINHECAHFLVTYFTKCMHDHDEQWKSWAEFLGGFTETVVSYDDFKPKNAKYVVACNDCKRVFFRQRRSKAIKDAEAGGVCAFCGGALEVREFIERE